ncbi:MAG TPA: hypothetical protein VJK05_00735 [archaeon]|nr:hypothetical protein [archaeon]
MSTLTVQFKGVQKEILEKITSSGIAETKSEAIRMALLKLAIDFDLYEPKMLVKAIRKDLGKDKKKINEILMEVKRAKHGNISR